MFIPLINVSKRQSFLRIAAGVALLVVGTHTYWWLTLPGLLLLITALTYYCPVCHLFNIQTHASRENFYLSQLPRYNSQPICIVNRQGEFHYTNKRFLEMFPEVKSFYDFGKEIPADIGKLIYNEDRHRLRFASGNSTYQVLLHGIRAIDGIAGFFSDITETIRMDQEIIDTQKEIVYTMGEIGETRSEETGNHVRRVAEYSRLIAIGYGLSSEEAALIQISSPMHDIGKVGIPDSILKKPGKLTAEEYEIMKTHAKTGHDMLNHSDRPILKAASIIAGEHHEKWDGTGYPNGTAGSKIHLYGRITAVADVFDALGSDRVYKKAWPMAEIVELFHEEREKHFDPDLVDILFTHLDKFKAIKDKYSDQHL